MSATESSSSKHCNSRHPWWFGICCELEPNHRSDNHEARLDDYSYLGAKIKWPRKEEK